MTTDTKAPSLREALHGELSDIFEQFLAAHDGDRSHLESVLREWLWDNKAGLVAALEATPPAPTPSAGRALPADELRMLARLAWNGWPDNEKSRSELASFEAKDDISRVAWDRVVAAILTATRPAAGLDAPHNSGERLPSSDAAERAAGRPNIALLPDAAAIRAAAFEEAAGIVDNSCEPENGVEYGLMSESARAERRRRNATKRAIAAAVRAAGENAR